jgi:hypothetical protein
MTMKRALGLMMLVLWACGPGGDTPTSSRAGPARLAERGSKAAERDLTTLRDSFTWADASQPARDWDVDAQACQGRAEENPSVRKGAHPLVRVGVFMKCMEEMGWTFKGGNR